MDRLKSFREYMTRMNPVSDPGGALSSGLYVHPPGRSVADELALRLELEPTSTHIVLGGIGCGKTTEVLYASQIFENRLSASGDRIRYVDVSRHHTLDAQLCGVLVALAGKILRAGLKTAPKERLTKEVQAAAETLRKHAEGYTEWVEPYDGPEPDYEPDEHDYDPSYPVERRGVLVPPLEAQSNSLTTLIEPLEIVKAAVVEPNAHLILAFDSLDRLPTPKRFQEAVKDDLRILKRAGLGTIVVGPMRFAVSSDRVATELFDHQHFQLAIEPVTNGLDFLRTVLRTRASSDLLPDGAASVIAAASGGVIRDLLALAKSAAEAAYVGSRDAVGNDDVQAAVDGFGRNLAVGLDDSQVRALKHLRDKGGFVVRGDGELSLVETRRVLLYPNSRWRVHPALAPLLDSMPTPPGVL